MNVWTDTALTAIYTLSPMHYGIGQAAAAVDLPIAREAGSGLPILPASGIKGVARDFLASAGPDLDEGNLKYLFGPKLGGGDKEEKAEAGALTFMEGRLIAYPVRSLNRPFLHATCPLILERLARDLRLLGRTFTLLPEGWAIPGLQDGKAQVAGSDFGNKDLVLEDLVYTASEVGHSKDLETFAANLAKLLPEAEKPTRDRLASGLVLIPDQDFADLMQRAIPVRARVKLTGGKTTDTWKDPVDGHEESGNLWYEEYLPPDCLFLAIVGQRRERRPAGDGDKPGGERRPALAVLREHAGRLATVQMGGHETVGYGLCWWTGW